MDMMLAREGIQMFDYKKLPSCAKSCEILQVSEANCIPATQRPDSSTFHQCVCQSEYLRSLHTSGAICHHVCSDEDDEVIQHNYNLACHTPEPTKTGLAAYTSTITTTTNSTVVKATESSTHPTMETPQAAPRANETWLSKNGGYLVMATGVVLAAIAILVVFIVLRRRYLRKKDLESLRWRSRPVRLQVMPSLSRLPLCHDDNPVWPLTPPTPTQKFGETIRAYARDSRENSTTFGTQGPGVSYTPTRSLSRTERLIRDRIWETGRPDIPISATPKICR